jgi:hypothetical protein
MATFETRLAGDDDRSKIAWNVTALVEKHLSPPPKYGQPWEMVSNIEFRGFAAIDYPVAHLKPTEKSEDGLITFSVGASYELWVIKKFGSLPMPRREYQGAFQATVEIPYHFTDNGDFVVDDGDLAIDDAMPRLTPPTGDKAVALWGFVTGKRDGTAPGPKYVMLAPIVGLPSTGTYDERGSTWGGEIGKDISLFFNLIKFDGSGSYSRSSTQGRSVTLPSNTFSPGWFRINLDVARKEFPRPVPAPLPVDLPSYLITTVFFAKSDQATVDGVIAADLRKWRERLTQFDAAHKDLPSLIEGIRHNKLTVYCDGYADMQGSETLNGQLHNDKLSAQRANNVKQAIKERFGSAQEPNTNGHGNETAQWRVEVNKRRKQVPRDADRAVVIWMDYREVEKYLRGK